MITTNARPVTMVLRSLLVRCPRCGGGKLFSSYFRLKPRCPTCGYKFIREEGFWLGGYVMNVVIGEGLLAIHLLVFATVILNNPDTSLAPWLIGAIAFAIIPPILFFPMSRTTWAAVDLLMHPLEPWEVADADLAVSEAEKNQGDHR